MLQVLDNTKEDFDGGAAVRFAEIDTEYISRERRRRRWTREGFAKRSKVGVSTIKRIEDGKRYPEKEFRYRDGRVFIVTRVKMATLDKIAAALGMDASDLLLPEDEVPSE